MSLEGREGGEGGEGLGGEGEGGRGGMTLIHIPMTPQYLNTNHVLRNNGSRHSIGSTPNNGT